MRNAEKLVKFSNWSAFAAGSSAGSPRYFSVFMNAENAEDGNRRLVVSAFHVTPHHGLSQRCHDDSRRAAGRVPAHEG